MNTAKDLRRAFAEDHSKRNKGTLANLNKNYVKTDIFQRELGRKIGAAEEIRHASDYDDFYLINKDKTRQQILTKQEFLNMAKEYCERNYGTIVDE